MKKRTRFLSIYCLYYNKVNICKQISLFSKLFIICIIAKKCLKSLYDFTIQFKTEMNSIMLF